MKQWLKRISGIEALERELEQTLALHAAEAEEERKRREEEELELLSKRDPKEYATRKQEPWIAVIDTKVNTDDIRNGFFELDWNEYFIKELIANGYGTVSDPEEETVDRWFRDIVYNMFGEEGLDKSRGAGYINVVPISKGKSEVS